MVALSSLAGAGWQFFGNNGLPLAGGKLYTYAAGTTTPLATYTSVSGATPHANPIILDSAGRVPSEIWLTSTSTYKFTLKTSADVEIWTKDNVPGIMPANTALSAVDVAYDPPFTGGLTSGYTVSDKLEQVVSVQDFGAVGDSVTDDTAAIQAAVNYAFNMHTSKHVTVHVPAGCYIISQSILMRPHVRLVGDGEGTGHSNAGLSLGYNTEIRAAPGFNNWAFVYNSSSYAGTGDDVAGIADAEISNISYRGRWTGPGDTTTTVGGMIKFDGVFPIQGCRYENIISHAHPESVIYCNVMPLPGLFNNIWGRLVGRSVLEIYCGAKYSGGAPRTTHFFRASNMQGDFIVNPLIDIDGTPVIESGGSFLGTAFLFDGGKHEIDSGQYGSSPTTQYSKYSIRLTNVDRAAVLVQSYNTIPSSPYGTGYPDVQDGAILLVNGVFRKGNYWQIESSSYVASVASGYTNNLVYDTTKCGEPNSKVSLAQTRATAGSLTLNGTDVSGGVATFPVAAAVSVTSTGNDSARTYTITGTDQTGAATTETITGPNTSTVFTTATFKTVTDVAVVGGGTVGTVNVGSAVYAVDRTYKSAAWNPDKPVYIGDATSTVVSAYRRYINSSGTHDTYNRREDRADGRIDWGSGDDPLDTNLYRDGTNGLRSDGPIVGTRVYQRGGAALTASNFTLTGWGTGAAISVDSGSTDGRWRVTITAGTTPSVNPSFTLAYTSNYSTAMYVNANMSNGTGAPAVLVVGSPAISGAFIRYTGTPVSGLTYIIQGYAF